MRRHTIALQPLGLLLQSVLMAAIILPTTIVAEPNICLEQVSSTPAVWMQEYPAGGAMVLALQTGLIQVAPLPKLRSNTTSDLASLYLDLRNRTLYDVTSETGFYSFAFHPNFAKNGRFFVSYICNATDCQGPCACTPAQGCPANCTIQTLVAEYSAGPDPTVPKTITTGEVHKILHIGRPTTQRDGGQIWFGPDGYLYFASGDGGVQNPALTAQDGKAPFGKILRVDVDSNQKNNTWGYYGIPASNPFVGATNVAPEVYALGFRNPWRCSVDPVTNITVCGDVGESDWEEVDVIKAGGNYGWPFFEGPERHPQSGSAPSNLEPPVLAYPHPPDAYTSVIGGYVYRGSASSCLTGLYVYGDGSGSAYVGTFPPLSANAASDNATLSVSLGEGLDSMDFLLSWAVDLSNELYRLSQRGIYRVVNASDCKMDCGTSLLQEAGPPGSGEAPLPSPKGASGLRRLLVLWPAYAFLLTLAVLVRFQ